MTTRRPVTIFEIDFDQCTLTYGAAPCTAALGTTGVRKCFNTFKTCQDTANYDRGTLTLRFGENIDGLPKDVTIFPIVASASAPSPVQINLGGVDERTGPLGRRASGTVVLKDIPYHDRLTDKYAAERVSGAAQTDEGGYNPAERGTMLAKIFSRNPYLVGREIRRLYGYVGETLASMRKEHFIITAWTGPDSDGNVTIEYKSVLDLADERNALAPKPSQGKLQDDLPANFLGFTTLTPPGIGATYSTGGRIAIGSEVLFFTRSGDVINIFGRGQDGTDAAAHSAGDTVQECYRAENRPVADVINDLLVNYTSLDQTWITLADWQAEANRWLPALNLTGTIMKPEGVLKLLGEICQHGVYIFEDLENRQIRLRANRPVDLDETFTTFTEEGDIIQGSASVRRRTDKRISQIIFAHGVLDASRSHTDLENYANLEVIIDADAEGENEFGQPRTHIIYSRWLGGSGSSSIAAATARRLINRYRDVPNELTMSIEIGEIANLDLAGLIKAQTRLIQDDLGNAAAEQMQIVSRTEIDPGSMMQVTAQSFEFDGRFGFVTFNGYPDYGSATQTQRERGAFIVGPSLLLSDGSGPYQIF